MGRKASPNKNDFSTQLEEQEKNIVLLKKEIQIEAALEKVRARTMAMQKSEELGDVVKVLYQEFKVLGMADWGCAIMIFDKEANQIEYWVSEATNSDLSCFYVKGQENSVYQKLWKHWEKQGESLNLHHTDEFKEEFDTYWLNETDFKRLPEAVKESVYADREIFLTFSTMQYGMLNATGKTKLSEGQIKVLERFAKVFEQTYTRFLDLQKAEEQAREARIETALEKIRSNMMAMHQSDQLRQVVATMFEQLQNLGFDSSASMINIYNDDLSAEQWLAGFSHGELPKSYYIPYCEHPYFTEEVSGWQDGLSFHELIFEGPQKVEYGKWMIENSDYKFLPAEFHQEMLSPERIYISNAHMKYGLVEVWGAETLPEKSINILIRFAKVFEQTYTRFLDLQKAEEQARESQIEASMERVRARAMAMHTTGELNELVALIYDEIQKLGLFDYGCSIIICDEANKVLQFWYAEINQLQSFRCYNVPINSQPVVQEQYQSWKKGLTQFDIEIRGKEHKEYIEFLLTETDHKELPEEVKEGWRSFSEVFFTYSNFKYGLLEFVDVKPIDKNNYPIYQRFAKVFEQTYTRFLDLKKAEKQAKEAQIETALEKVRSRTMAMHSSQELGEAVDTLLKQFKILGFDAISSWVSLMNPEENTIEFWTKHEEKLVAGQSVHISELINFEKEMESWEKGEESIHLSMPFKLAKLELKKIFGIELVGEESNTFYLLQLRHKYGFLGLGTLKESNEEIRQTVQRFAKVFDQTYTRFLDLQKAEAQAREAQIETALEKVRSRTMAMQKSEELLDLVKKIYSEIEPFGVSTTGITLALFREDENAIENWFADNLHSDLLQSYKVVGQKNKVFKQIWEDWKNKNPQRKVYLEGPDKRAYDNYILTETDYRQLPEELKEEIHSHKTVCFTFTYFKYGYFESVDLTIPAEENAKILLRFAKVFEQTYTRFLDLQKAEAQAKEAEIELALERVRARTMAMHRSDELIEVVKTLSLQFLELKPDMVGNWLSLVDIESNSMKIIGSYGDLFHEYIAHGSDRVSYQHDIDAYKKGVPHWQFSLPKEVILEIWRETLDFEDKDVEIPEGVTEYHLLHIRHAFGFFGFGSWEKADEETIAILSRFCKVFEQTYTRFLDLQKAEAQAREAQIEAALERVRSRSMAMQKSDELKELVHTLSNEIGKLDIIFNRAFICIYDTKTLGSTWWMRNPESNESFGLFIKYHELLPYQAHLKAWRERKTRWHYILKEEDKKEWDKFLFDETEFSLLPEHIKNTMRSKKKLYLSTSFSNFGYLALESSDSLSDEQFEILSRFAKVFDLTYTRFLDIQKAEEQAREAEIQLALERVRARAMAMHQSQELAEVVALMYGQIQSLGFTDWGCAIIICDEEAEVMYYWYADINMSHLPDYFKVPLTNKTIKKTWELWKQGTPQFIIELHDEKMAEYVDFMLEETDHKTLPQEVKDGWRSEKNVYFSYSNIKYGLLEFTEVVPFKEENFTIYRRFAHVLEQTYTRFLDLQKAEAQTREAQIEASMERIRSRSLAMRTSDEIKDVMVEIRRQIDSLGQLDLEASVVHLYEKGNPMFESIAAVRPPGESGNIVLANVFFPVDGTDRIKDMMDYYWSDTREYTLEFDKEMAEEWQQVMLTYAPMIAERRVGFVENRRISDYSEYWNFADFSEGSLLLVTHSPASEDTKTVLRKASQVFDLAYRRYRDLQKAEARAKEAIKQASLDRVRGEIASMRSTEDLNRITPLIWNELSALGVSFIRCGVFIIDEKSEIVDIYLSSPDGKSLGVMKLPFNSNDLTANTVKAWKKDCVYHQFWSRDAFISWTNSLVSQGFISDKEKYQGNHEAPGALNLNFIPFTQGMLYVGTAEELPNSEVELVKSLAKAFALAYSRYEDFVKLEMAKSEIESTLSELKATQAQLIQSEKMASLGELTAGIAHEIQNPLNFVNNFSEVSSELIVDMVYEVDNGNYDEVKAIAMDVQQNLEKINHHGQRASSIVKGMLEHSRTSSGQKELTDINALCDEYLRLSYHGLKAKDKSFNAELKTDFDESIGRINIIPQDIGRVLLNLINNAFYAVQLETQNSASLQQTPQKHPDYKPLVMVSTKNMGNHVEIRIKDNGPGIPDAIKEKIFQPFFTTKPTGQGTGLGLSLSYDIVKAHGGELKVETVTANTVVQSEKDSTGSKFIIVFPS